MLSNDGNVGVNNVQLQYNVIDGRRKKNKLMKVNFISIYKIGWVFDELYALKYT